MIVEDFVCLGRTVPEESKKYGHRVCMAGYSRELNQFMRVYPLPVQNPLRARHQYVLGLERNKDDSRKESWKLTDRVALYESTHKSSEDEIRQLLRDNVSESIDELNSQRRSIGVIKPENLSGEFQLRENCGTLQMDLFEFCDHQFGANAVKAAPYLRFEAGGRTSRLQLREWGCYEWIRKNPGDCSQLWKNLSVGDESEKYLLIGNMNNRRNCWLVIMSFSFKLQIQKSFLEVF